MLIVRIRHKLLGGHVHMRVFVGRTIYSLGLAGNLVMREDEFEQFKRAMDRDSVAEFVEEESGNVEPTDDD